MPERIAMFGAGALGGYVGGHFALQGHDLVLIDMWHEHIEAIRRDGLHLSGMTEEENQIARPKTLHMHEIATQLVRKPIDIAFISVKSYDTDWVAQLLKPYLAPGGFVVSLQNGLNEERIANIVEWGRTVGCIAHSISVELFKPGHIRRGAPKGAQNHTVFRVGELHGRVTERAQRVSDMLSTIDSSKVTTNLWGERWSKLSQNAMRNGMSAVTGLSGRDMDKFEHVRRFEIQICAEAVQVGKALGYSLEKIGKLSPEKVILAARGNSAELEEIENILIAATSGSARSEFQRPSMGQDFLKGRRTEIEFLNGLIVQKGEEIGIPTPANRRIQDLVFQVERGELAPSPDNIPRSLA